MSPHPHRVTLQFGPAGLSSVQDAGRFHYSHLGISVNGSADQYSASCANVLVGNAIAAPLIEITAHGLSFTTDADILLACTGAAAELQVAGTPQRQWQPVVASAGSTVSVRNIRGGLRSYVAMNGQLQAEPVMGSVSPDVNLGIGAYLRGSDELTLVSAFRNFNHPHTGHPVLLPAVRIPRFQSPWTVFVTPGPELPEFGDSIDALYSESYDVATESNHVGIRLRGRTPTRQTGGELLSRGVPVGAVELPPSGEMIVLMRGRSVTAGYPIVAVASRVSQSTLGQVRPGDVVRFRAQTVEQALRDARAQSDLMHDLQRRVAALLSNVPAAVTR